MNISSIQNNTYIVLSPFAYSLLQTFSTNVVASHIFAAIIGIPSALLYIFELIILFKYWKEFKSSFFVLFILRAIICLTNFFFSYMNQRFLKLGWFIPIYQQMPTFVLAIFYFFIYYPFHVEDLASIFMIINRLSAVAFPLEYEDIWTKKRVIASVIFCIVAPLTITYHILQYSPYLSLMNEYNWALAYSKQTLGLDNGFITYYKLIGIFSNNNGVATLTSIFFMAVTLILNIFTLIIFKRKNNLSQQENTSITTNKILMERKLTVYVLVTFLGQLIISLFMSTWFTVSALLKPFIDNDTFNLLNFAIQVQSPWVNDISTIALPAWFMLWANDRLKQTIFQIIFKTKVSDSSQIPNKNQKKLFVQRSKFDARKIMMSVSCPESELNNNKNQNRIPINSVK